MNELTDEEKKFLLSLLNNVKIDGNRAQVKEILKTMDEIIKKLLSNKQKEGAN